MQLERTFAWDSTLLEFYRLRDMVLAVFQSIPQVSYLTVLLMKDKELPFVPSSHLPEASGRARFSMYLKNLFQIMKQGVAY